MRSTYSLHPLNLPSWSVIFRKVIFITLLFKIVTHTFSCTLTKLWGLVAARIIPSYFSFAQQIKDGFSFNVSALYRNSIFMAFTSQLQHNSTSLLLNYQSLRTFLFSVSPLPSITTISLYGYTLVFSPSGHFCSPCHIFNTDAKWLFS